jgi:thiamine-monophosphate kinase
VISEFEIIRKYFTRPATSAVLGVGDDCALVTARKGMALALSTDMLLAGRHFLPDADPDRLGRKALAVNLSDLAAMGAEPRWALLAIALPKGDEKWIAAFSRGFFRLARRFGTELIGGDTTRGPLAISITVIGEVPQKLALRRDAARAGDDIWLSGATGEAALGLAHLKGRVKLAGKARSDCLARLHSPEPRVRLGLALRGLARSAIDVSDGLLADLGHVAKASGLAAELRWEDIPRAKAIAECPNAALARNCLLAGGDDYELVFTAPVSARARIRAAGRKARVPVTPIGTMVRGRSGVRVCDAGGHTVPTPRAGFDHFA